MQKRAKDGIIFVEPELCVGCKSCITACPWGTPQWNPETGKAVKCDYCRDRIDQGLKPACVTKCLTQCLDFGLSTNEATRPKRDRFAIAVAFQVMGREE
jgi:Fe-S-cluster-containing dehydrogenase component